MDTSTRISGHGLWSEGWPVDVDPESSIGWRSGRHRTDAGSALCQCGEISPEFGSLADRKRWHREHKEQVRAG